MNLIWSMIIIFIVKFIDGREQKCLINFKDPHPEYISYGEKILNFTIQTNNQINHKLMSYVLEILLKEVYGYQNVTLINTEYKNDPIAVFNEMIKPTLNSLPDAMVNLEITTPPDTDYKDFVVAHNLEQFGNVSPFGKYGFFIPKDSLINIPAAETWKYFKNQINSEKFSLKNQIDLLKNHIKSNDKYICEMEYCEEGFYIPNHCKNLTGEGSCAILLTSFPETTGFIVEHIDILKLYMKVVWLGEKLKIIQDELTKPNALPADESFIFLEWNPGYFTTGNQSYATITMPNCHELHTKSKTDCIYELNSNIKVVWDKLFFIASKARDLIYKMKFNWNSYRTLLQSYDVYSNRSLWESSCEWVKNSESIWREWVPETIPKKTLHIGGIFPMTSHKYNGIGTVIATKMAIDAINLNTSILNNYDLKLLVNDGMCSTDMVLIRFIDYILTRDINNIIGILGPACSETLEPLIGISKYYSSFVISYSAEASRFSDRSKYPYFFRTIGENDHYKKVYLSLFKKFGWKRAAALTEDGQKLTEYISSMGDLLRTHNISLIANVKFPKDSTEYTLNKRLRELKQAKAKIIIADIYDEIARIVMCEAYKLNMIGKYGYVWFLPSWLPSKWYNTTHFNKLLNENVKCTLDMMGEAIEGYFSLNHAPFGNEDSIMQEGITVGEWIKKYKNQMEIRSNATKRITLISSDPYKILDGSYISESAGYAYDAVWIYALAFHELLAAHPEDLSTLKSPITAMKILNIIDNMEFNGVSGNINFYGTTSRFSTINIFQWQNGKVITVGSYYPNITKNGTSIIMKDYLEINNNSIMWLTPDGSIPEDGTVPPDICLLEPIANLLNVSCSKSVMIVNMLLIGTLIIFLSAIIVFLRKRYERKIKMNEKLMKAVGFGANGSLNTTDLDKWETPRECVVLNRKLGEGAFGNVFGGEALLSERKGWVAVAVKTLKVGSSREQKLDFLSEAESMKRFEHKNIVKLLGVCTKNEPFYTIMEFMLYGDLKTYLLARRHLVNSEHSEEREEISSKKLTGMALDVARALSYLAELKYVHRDVACRNCLVNAQRVVKLGDFGMTRLIFENDCYLFSRKGMLPVRWMAPESLSLGIFTPASDIWSFGVLLYEIITFGNFPFQGMSNNEVLEHIKNGNTLNIPQGVKPQLEGLMKSCWNLEYKTRPHASEIAEFLANSPRLLTTCLDGPLSSVEIDFYNDFNNVREPATIPNMPKISENIENEDPDISVLNLLQFDNPTYLTTQTQANGNMNRRTMNINNEETQPFM